MPAGVCWLAAGLGQVPIPTPTAPNLAWLPAGVGGLAAGWGQPIGRACACACTCLPGLQLDRRSGRLSAAPWMLWRAQASVHAAALLLVPCRQAAPDAQPLRTHWPGMVRPRPTPTLIL